MLRVASGSFRASCGFLWARVWRVCRSCVDWRSNDLRAGAGGPSDRPLAGHVPSVGGRRAHAEEDALKDALSAVGEGTPIDARGVKLSKELVARVVDAAPVNEEGNPCIRGLFTRATFRDGADFVAATFGDAADFMAATFGDRADFTGATFGDRAYFVAATFGDDADFGRSTRATFGAGAFVAATFGDDAGFTRATFGEGADFSGATFGDRADFSGATFGDRACFMAATFGDDAYFGRSTRATLGAGADFGDDADFTHATFGDRADFSGATFGDRADFTHATFGDRADFSGATFGDRADFSGATFGDRADFSGATFGDRADFTGARFRDAAAFSGTEFHGSASFADARFGDDAYFSGAKFGGDASFEPAVFGRGADFRAGSFSGALSLRGAIFGESVLFGRLTVVAALNVADVTWEGPLLEEIEAGALAARRLRGLLHPLVVRVTGSGTVDLSGAQLPPGSVLTRGADTSLSPVVRSIARADVGGVTFTDVDLASCDMEGAINLERLILDGWTRLGRAPSALLFRPTNRGRQVLAAECCWRAAVWRGSRGWPWDAVPQGFEGRAPQLPNKLSTQYRALRKGREDSKDEPGAADFYYGEMEMRRYAAAAASVDRVVLTAYWLLSGYGLRAGRAALAFLVAVTAFAGAFWWFGFGQRQGYGTALLESAESATSLLRGPGTSGPALTAAGEGLALVLRLLGPVLLGLAVLSLRGRIKR